MATLQEEMLGEVPPAPAVSSEEQQQAQEQKTAYDDLFVFAQAKTRLQQLKQTWNTEIQDTYRRRLLRNVDINPAALRSNGDLLPDETMIPMRVIDTNIRREQPSFINFLKGTNRMAVFECISNPQQDVQRLEAEFSRVTTYVGWEKPHYKEVDGAQTHGWDAIEVVSDDTLPGHLGIEHIGHDKLLFNLDSIDFQANELILRVYSFSLLQLKRATSKHGFDPKQVKQLEDQVASSTSNPVNLQGQQASPKDRNVTVYRKLCKYDGMVYVSWFSFDCDDWLKAPQPLYIGRKEQRDVEVQVPNPAYQQALQQQQVVSAASPVSVNQPVSPLASSSVPGSGTITGNVAPQLLPPPTITTVQKQWVDVAETEYPIFILPYSETEEQEICAHKGRVFLDQHKQEALTAICSGYINGLNRASNIYGSVDNPPDGSTAAPKQIETKLQPAGIYDRRINFWSTGYPDPSVLSGMQFLDTYNSQEVGQVNFAANNRKDSRKTATEIGVASQQQAALSSVQVSLYSAHLRELYSFMWPIIQSRALAGLIKFLQKQTGSTVDFTTGQTIPTYANDVAVIGLSYNVKAAGDQDVIQRSEMLMRMKQDWPVYSQTPLAMEFLKEMIVLSYPTMASKWTQILSQADPKAIIQQLLVALQGALGSNPQALAALPPEQQQQLSQLMQMASQVAAPPAAASQGAQATEQPTQQV